MFKKIALRIVLLAGILLLSNVIYKQTTYSDDLESDANILTKFEKAQENADILYFSSSPNATFADGVDQDTRSISNMVDDSISEYKIMSVDTGAIHAGVFKKLIQLIPDNSKTKKIIIHLNYRSLGIGWIQSSLENAILKEFPFYSNRPVIVSRFLQGLNTYEAVAPAERKRLMLNYWATQPLPFDPPKNTVENWCAVEKWGDWTNPKRQLADHYIKNYAFSIQEDNPRLQDYDAIVELCEAKNIDLIYVILPENVEEAEMLVDPDLVDLMKSNRDLIKKRYESKGVEVIDCFDLLPDEDFLERNFPSEHYFEHGRKAIASKIIERLNKIN
ncbi:MAG: hypothetical protein ABJG68_08530 [Crocinitomicaceae bacterium]